MSLSPAAKATRDLLKRRSQDAFNGSLTTDEVISQVREQLPGAYESTIYRAIGSYGPIGEGDLEWLQRAEKGVIRSWFYNPRTGESLE